MITRARFAAAALFTIVSAHVASAQGFINPATVTTVTSPSSTGSKTTPGFSVAIGSIGGFIGAETEIA